MLRMSTQWFFPLSRRVQESMTCTALIRIADEWIGASESSLKPLSAWINIRYQIMDAKIVNPILAALPSVAGRANVKIWGGD